MAYKKIQFKRGTKTGMPVLRSGEPGFTQDEKSLYIGDGTANQRFLNEIQTNTRIDEKIAPVTQSITNNVATLNESIASNITTVNQAITDKAKINGEATNVNFKENQVVQDGLVVKNLESFSSTTGGALKTIPIAQTNSPITLFLKVNGNNYTNTRILKLSTNFYIYALANKLILRDANPNQSIFTELTLQNGLNHIIAITFDGIKASARVEGKTQSITTNNISVDTTEVVLNPFKNFDGSIDGVLLYNRILTPQEIQHTLSILNNIPSINRINDYAIATDTDHIQDRTGRVQEELNRVFYKNMCKEFTSSGGDITVNNGMEGYLLSATLQGNTVKNVLQLGSADRKPTDLYFKSSQGVVSFLLEKSSIKPSTAYTIVSFMRKNNSQQRQYTVAGNSLTVLQGVIFYEPNENGIKILNLTSLADFTGRTLAMNTYLVDTSSTAEYSIVILEGTYSLDNLPIRSPFEGLSSTQATITANNMKYSFYSLTDDKLNNKVIQLGGVGDVRDTLEIKEDGSAIWTQNSAPKTFDALVEWVLSSAYSDETYLCAYLAYPTAKADGVLLCNMFVNDKYNTNPLSKECIGSYGSYFNLKILKSRLSTPDLDGLKKWFSENNLTVRHILATPVVTTIPKELVPTILTQATNTFTFGDAVAPYSVTIKAPTTDDIAKSYTVSLLNAYTQTPSTAIPIVNLLNTGIVRLQMDLTAPSTLLNATLFSVAPELRPVTNAKIPVFVNGVCVLGVVDKTTGNVNLPSVPSASANVYIKTDYRRDN